MLKLNIIFAHIKKFPKVLWNFITREKLFYPFLITTFLLLNLFFIGHRVRFVMLGDELNRLNKELSVAISLNQKLSSEAVRLSALPRIEAYAKDSCGMVPTEKSSRIIVLWDKKQEKQEVKPIDKAVCSIRRKADEIILPEEDFVKGF
ncbi:MAG: hypothetical protein ACLFSQ_09575 [Candidatus Zixiibacteriota bacterium]